MIPYDHIKYSAHQVPTTGEVYLRGEITFYAETPVSRLEVMMAVADARAAAERRIALAIRQEVHGELLAPLAELLSVTARLKSLAGGPFGPRSDPHLLAQLERVCGLAETLGSLLDPPD